MANHRHWDPTYGQGGEWVPGPIPDNQQEGWDAEEEEEDVVPTLPPVIADDKIVKDKYLVTDEETGAVTVTTDPDTGQGHYTLKDDLLGGVIEDPRIGLPGVNDDVTFDQIDTRWKGRDRGFEGDFNEEREIYYLEDDGGRRGLVDQYGYQTAAGTLDDIVSSDTADMPTGATYTAEMIGDEPLFGLLPHSGDIGEGGTFVTAPTIGDVDDSKLYIGDELPQIDQAKASYEDAQQSLGQVTDAQYVGETAAEQYSAMQQYDKVAREEATAAQLAEDIQRITAQQEEVNDKSTVRGQLSRLSSEFDGGETPAWAKGAIGAAEQIMAARGLGASSIAGSVITAAAMNTMMPIAQADASIYAEFQRLNLNNRQQAEVQNAANLLTMDIKNVDNRQQTALFNTNNRVQALFSDQSEVNASARINAASVNQTNQFFKNLQQSVFSNNANQRNAMGQFNSAQSNSMALANADNQLKSSTFNAQQGNAIQQFIAQQAMEAEKYNAENYKIISQSNTQWARATNTANTAAMNAQNQLNATNIFNRSNTALNNQIQIMRDKADYTFNASQNQEQRQSNLAVATLQAEASRLAGQSGGGEGSFLGAAGGILGDIFGNWAGTESGGKAIGTGLSKAIDWVGGLWK